MNTISQSTSYLVEPKGDEGISPRALGYITEMTRDSLYDYIVRKFLESGISQATLAKRLCKEPSQISRLLGAPGNWTIDTCAELLFAIDGSALRPGSYKPLDMLPANMRGPFCLNDHSHSTMAQTRTGDVSSQHFVVKKLYADQSALEPA